MVRYRTLLAALARLACALTFVATASSAGIVQLPSEAEQAIDKMYGAVGAGCIRFPSSSVFEPNSFYV